jgi:hypothetical protein
MRILASLRELDESGFAWLLRERRVPTRGLADPIDLAEWLEDPTNIDATLGRMRWPTLRGLRLGDEAALAEAARLQLAVTDGERPRLLPRAAQTLAELLPEVPDFTAEADAAAAANPVPSGADRAQEAAQLASDALWLLDAHHRPVQHARSGVRLSAVELRRLAVDLERPVEVVDAVYEWLASTELIAPTGPTAGDQWAPTEAGREFPRRPVTERWRILAAAWARSLTIADVRAAAWFDEPAEGSMHPAVALGLADATRAALTRLGGLVLDDRLDEATAALAPELAEPVTGVYVQPDQTIVAPGPLSGDDDAALRSFAQLEHRALASQYRLTQSSIERALLSGATISSIHDRLERLSLTGIPQPVAYLLESSAERFGRVRVRAHVDDHGRVTSRVRAESAQLFDTLRIDTALSSLALRVVPAGEQRDEAELASVTSPETALLTLVEARYPAAMETVDGELRGGLRRVTAEPYEPEPNATLRSAAEALAEHAASAPPRDDEATWLRRRLELARRDRLELRPELALGDERTAELNVIPIAVTDQRLRARDTGAEVERTVPLRAIVAVEGTRVARHD